MKHSDRQFNRSGFTAIAGALIVFVIFALVLWQTDLLKFTGSDPSSKVVAAAIALVGAFLGTLITFVGILLKNSLDQQAEHRLQLEAERNEALQRDAEQRLKLEAAIRAVQLFTTSAGNLSPDIQRAGALLTLSSLGQYKLVLTLTSELLSSGLIASGTVALLIDQALLKGEEEEKRNAISLFLDYSERFLTTTGAVLPSSITSGSNNFPPFIRGWIPIILGRIIAARPLAEWRKYRFSFYEILSILAIDWQEESIEEIKGDVGAILKVALQVFADSGHLQHPRMSLDTYQIRLDVKSASPKTTAATELVERLNMWYKETP
jgi:hypothetical protein